MERRTALVVDAGPLVAYVDRDNPAHRQCVELLADASGPLVVPVLTIAEAAYFIGRRLHLDAELRFLGDFSIGSLIADPVQPADWLRIAELVEQYADLPLGTVDASIVAAAERWGVSTIATLDRRHFSVVRPAHVDSFELVP